ncbi:MAG: polysaccharide deacetylase family protein, partial [Bacteriovoracaceae bacterium]|nr:polysaccharide deacetylase family protein [Bacteriovoracaceae bacterium]
MKKIINFVAIFLFTLNSYAKSNLEFSPDYFQFKKILGRDLGLKSKQIALTFDDGPSIHTERLLEVLLAYQIPATFFVVNQSIQALKPEYVEKVFTMIRDNPQLFTLANHSSDHTNFYSFRNPVSGNITNRSKLIQELMETHQSINPYQIKDYIFFRAPYGNFTNTMSHFYNVDESTSEIAKKYIGPVYWDVGGFYDSLYSPRDSDGSIHYQGDYACWGSQWMARVKKAGKNPVTVCTDGYFREIKNMGENPKRTSGIVVLSHDIWKGTVEMYVGSTKVEEGTIVSEDANSLIYKILQLKEEGFEFVG